MSHSLRIVQLNLAYSPALSIPSALLDAYHTLTGWADAAQRGDLDACAAALVDLAAPDRGSERAGIMRHYADALSREHIGQRTVREYGAIAEARRDRLAR